MVAGEVGPERVQLELLTVSPCAMPLGIARVKVRLLRVAVVLPAESLPIMPIEKPAASIPTGVAVV